MVIKLYVTNEEYEEFMRGAKEADMPISSFIKSLLPFKEESLFRQKLTEAIHRANEVSVGTTFSVRELFTPIEWDDIRKKISTGQLGKQFFEQVKKGNVDGIDFKDMRGSGGVARYSKKSTI